MSGIAHSTGVSVTHYSSKSSSTRWYLVEWLAGEKVTCADDKKNEHNRNHLNSPERMTCAKTHMTCVDCESCDPLPLQCPSTAPLPPQGPRVKCHGRAIFCPRDYTNHVSLI